MRFRSHLPLFIPTDSDHPDIYALFIFLLFFLFASLRALEQFREPDLQAVWKNEQQ